MSCAITYSRGSGDRQSLATKRVKAAEKHEQRQEKAAAREKLMTMNQLYVLAQKDCNAYVRARDAGKGCISCDSQRIDDAGHLFPIGSKWRCHPLRLNAALIHGQCRKCNSYVGGGNLHGYLEGLKKRYGQEYVDQCYNIKAIAERGEYPLLDRFGVKDEAAKFRRKTRELKRAA